MQDPTHARMTLLGIAYDSGFNSKATFNRTFRQMTGKSTKEYIDDLKKERSTYNLRPYFHPLAIISYRQTVSKWSYEKLNRNYMFKNYFKTAWRSLFKNKVSSLINLGGLSVGMAAAMLMSLWIYDEVSYNRSYQNYDHIAQVMVHANYDGQIYTISSNPVPLAGVLRSAYANDFKTVVVSTAPQLHRIVSGDKEFNETGRFMEPGIADMLSLNMVYGSREGLKEPGSILLSACLAKKLFGAVDPVGQVISIDKKQIVKVNGVYEDQLGNSEFNDLGFIAPFELFLSGNDWARKAENDWSSQFVIIYTQLNDKANFAQVSAKIKNSKLTHVTGAQAMRKPIVFLQPMSRWHLYGKFENGASVQSDALKYVWFYGTIGLFVLLLACINFMNLSTARSEKRAKEVGIRKVIGSNRSQLVAQFYIESLLMVCFGFLLAIVLVLISLPWFNGIAGKAIHIPWANPVFWLSGAGFTLLTGLLAGSYPALYLSSFRPIKVLKGSFRVGRFAAVPRKVLVVLQFTFSIALIIGTIIVYRQIRFAQERPVGYSHNGLLTIPLTGDIQAKYTVLSHELKAKGAVTALAESSSPLTSIWSTSTDVDWNGKSLGLKKEFSTISVSSEYGKTIGWQFLSGRDFSGAAASDSGNFVVNETAVKEMGLKNPLGAVINYEGRNYQIIGVVKDMVMESPFKPASPTFFFLKGDRNCLFLKLNPALSAQSSLTKVMAVFKQLVPDAAIDYTFVDEDFAAKFAAEVRIGNLAGCFSGLAILISCLGLFGMASFLAEQRIKEIGVRKILGATVFNLWYTQSIDFVKLILFALLIAIPLSGYVMHGWLENYQYRITLSWWIFVAAGLGAIIIALLTVSYQSVKTALANPVKSLRSE
jgi:putative ABC transport system permease protein